MNDWDENIRQSAINRIAELERERDDLRVCANIWHQKEATLRAAIREHEKETKEAGCHPWKADRKLWAKLDGGG